MVSKRKSSYQRFKRPIGNKRYQRIFFIAPEGTKTEIQYFEMINNLQLNNGILAKIIKNNNNSSPRDILKRMKARLINWSQTKICYAYAINNPKFEYWLLLHFEEGNSIINAKDCDKRLLKYLPSYDKNLDFKKFDCVQIRQAITNAKKREISIGKSEPNHIGSSGLYRLVSKLISEEQIK